MPPGGSPQVEPKTFHLVWKVSLQCWSAQLVSLLISWPSWYEPLGLMIIQFPAVMVKLENEEWLKIP